MVSLSRAGARGDGAPQASQPPPFAEVSQFHTNADTDGDSSALHHTIGTDASQAAGGTHVHDGGDSAPLFQGQGISGVRGSTAYYNSVEALLTKLGATNSATG